MEVFRGGGSLHLGGQKKKKKKKVSILKLGIQKQIKFGKKIRRQRHLQTKQNKTKIAPGWTRKKKKIHPNFHGIP